MNRYNVMSDIIEHVRSIHIFYDGKISVILNAPDGEHCFQNQGLDA